MEQSYELIGQYLPADTANFFAQALEQMDVIGYPDNFKLKASLLRGYFPRMIYNTTFIGLLWSFCVL